MKNSIKKMAVLTALKNQPTALSLKDIALLLDQAPSERTLRRWLNDLVTEGEVSRLGNKRNTRYQASEMDAPEYSLFSQASLKSIESINEPLYLRDPVNYNFKWLDEYSPNKTFYFSKDDRKRLVEKGGRNQIDDPAGTYARKIYNRLLIDLSYNSSRLEGNTYSLVDTERLILKGIENTLKLDEEKVMILNHKEAIRYLVEQSHTLEITPKEIFTLHYLLSDGLILPEYSGKTRDHQVRITSTTYSPLDGDWQLEKQLNIICEKSNLIKEPYEQSLFLLIHISYLQAFTDVNKRTARLAANIPLIKNNLVPLSFNNVDKDDYLSAIICAYELNDVNPMADIYKRSYFSTCKEYDVTLEKLAIDEIRVRYRLQRREAISRIILKGLKSKKLNQYIRDYTNQNIPDKDSEHFIKNIHEDLENISPQKIIGMGISEADLEKWLSTK